MKKIDLDLGYAVAKDNIPINILQRPSFRQWIHSAVPGYKLPGIERMRYKIIPDIVHTTRDKLMKIIKESTSFTIILDIWSSKSMMGYIVLPAMPSPKHSSDTPSFLVDLCVTKPLEYWKSNQCRFPILSEIGRDAVSVAASSGSVERSFSVASDMLSAKRAAMKPDLFINLMLIKCNAGLKVGLRDAV
ncbi:Uncharacterized protein APZ42_031370 [Daphnia magna]|uniref:HAT C-terminal dimerisation domain-containing protein n=1 Tax=Daphnia magna TaxID=35525 RepID=A0A164MXK2_9CRUS|nr:Uncharacterized protein APZ42_031370 [Daphnia magna]